MKNAEADQNKLESSLRHMIPSEIMLPKIARVARRVVGSKLFFPPEASICFGLFAMAVNCVVRCTAKTSSVFGHREPEHVQKMGQGLCLSLSLFTQLSNHSGGGAEPIPQKQPTP